MTHQTITAHAQCGSLTVEVYRSETDPREWSWTVTRNAGDSDTGDSETGSGLRSAIGLPPAPASDMLRTCLTFLGADAERYEYVMRTGADEDGDGYLFGETVAGWAYLESDEVSMAAEDPTL